MDNIYILREIAKWNNKVWRLFSLLNREINEYFCIKKREYELCFRIIEVDKYRTYYKLDGKYHRSDGPAVIYNSGIKEWLVNGKYHRLDGPAIDYFEEVMKKYNHWYIDGKRIAEEYEIERIRTKENKN